VSYRAGLAGAALPQFNDLKDDQVASIALVDHLIILAGAP
jgi:hypothetical protein